MATAAQILANRGNAATSTGPQSTEGKNKVSQNALKSGLFSRRNCVAPEDADAFETLRAGLWETFAPQNPAEELFVAEIVRAGLRLQRCAQTEESLLDLTEPGEIATLQTSVDRARSGVLNRSMEQLRKLQTERWARSEWLPKGFDASRLGIASGKQVIAAVSAETYRKLASARVSEIENTSLIATALACMDPGARQSQFNPASDRPAIDSVAQAMAALLKSTSAPRFPAAKQTQSAPPAPAEPLRNAA
jgi:hypothetical protein